MTTTTTTTTTASARRRKDERSAGARSLRASVGECVGYGIAQGGDYLRQV